MDINTYRKRERMPTNKDKRPRTFIKDIKECEEFEAKLRADKNIKGLTVSPEYIAKGRENGKVVEYHRKKFKCHQYY